MRNLQECSTGELMDELKTRFDDCMIVGRRLVDPENEGYAYKRGHKGKYESVSFLLQHTAWCLQQEYNDSERDPEPWEEL